ncbi:hypothetical protein J2S77_002875 [Alkalibacillus salilacus]|uniref:Uncharacterized protein n=1 Tax=Alkalibacillus salilacus TaxID=284582 RepID=A0ABT9VIR9_9BACI|nr:hypothetical protein [Alkalibacillus salilacus]
MVNDQINSCKEMPYLMSTSIGPNSLENQWDDMVRSFVPEKLKTRIKEEMNQFFEKSPELNKYKNVISFYT